MNPYEYIYLSYRDIFFSTKSPIKLRRPCSAAGRVRPSFSMVSHCRCCCYCPGKMLLALLLLLSRTKLTAEYSGIFRLISAKMEWIIGVLFQHWLSADNKRCRKSADSDLRLKSIPPTLSIPTMGVDCGCRQLAFNNSHDARTISIIYSQHDGYRWPAWLLCLIVFTDDRTSNAILRSIEDETL